MGYPEPSKALVITPFDAAGRRVYDTVVRALQDTGISTFRFDSITAGDVWASAISDAIESARLVIADVSRNTPAVMYEVGFAHALRKPTLLLLDRSSGVRLPSSLAGHLFVGYDPSNLSDLSEAVARWAHQLADGGT